MFKDVELLQECTSDGANLLAGEVLAILSHETLNPRLRLLQVAAASGGSIFVEVTMAWLNVHDTAIGDILIVNKYGTFSVSPEQFKRECKPL